jgi:hypothetical protein
MNGATVNSFLAKEILRSIVSVRNLRARAELSEKKGSRKMTRNEIGEMLRRDMPGWRLLESEPLPAEGKRSFVLKVQKGCLVKNVVVIDGKVTTQQG